MFRLRWTQSPFHPGTKQVSFNCRTGIIRHRKADGILFIISSLGGGGAERVLCRLANMLSEKRRVFILYFREKKSIYPLKEEITRRFAYFRLSY